MSKCLHLVLLPLRVDDLDGDEAREGGGDEEVERAVDDELRGDGQLEADVLHHDEREDGLQAERQPRVDAEHQPEHVVGDRLRDLEAGRRDQSLVQQPVDNVACK